MLNFHGIWACFLFDIKKLLRSSRFYMTILVVFCYMGSSCAYQYMAGGAALQDYTVGVSFYFKLGVFTNGHCRRNAVFI